MRCLCTPNRYGYILFMASNMLSDGSELLLLVPSLAGIVGSVVLPILGAVPDGAIMLFSGLGPDAQEQLQVGVGALAGSTIMLLTIPWGGCIFAGAMPLSKSGEAIYSKKAAVATKQQGVLAKLSGHGVTPEGTIKTNAFLMVATSVCYLIIQGPAFQFAYGESGEPVSCLLPYPLPSPRPRPDHTRHVVRRQRAVQLPIAGWRVVAVVYVAEVAVDVVVIETPLVASACWDVHRHMPPAWLGEQLMKDLHTRPP